MAKQQWASYLMHPQDAFTDFYPLAKHSQMYTVMSAMLLFILVLKVRIKTKLLLLFVLLSLKSGHFTKNNL